LVTKYSVRKIVLKSAGVSTLGGVDIWYTPMIGRLNKDEHGQYLGNFGPNDKVMVIYKNGEYELTNFELTNHYEPRQVHTIAKYNEKGVISCIYYDGDQRNYHIKRFIIETSTLDKKFLFLTDHNRTELLMASYDAKPRIEIKYKKTRKSEQETELFKVEELIEVKGWKALGNKLNYEKIVDIKMLEPEIPEETEDEEVVDQVLEDQSDDNEEDDDSASEATEVSEDEEKEEPKATKKPKDDDHDSEGQLGLF
jgi:topoisomerase IV subunit A